MGIPSFINNILVLTPANPSYVGTLHVSGFQVNSTGTNWVARVTDNNSQLIFAANHSGTDFMPYSHSVSPSIQINNATASMTNVSELIIYTGWAG